MSLEHRRAQVSVEFIIIVGIIMLIVVSLLPYITKQNELNKAVAAARDGATYGAAMRGLGFKGGGVDAVPEGVIRIERVERVEVNLSHDPPWYLLRIHIAAPSYIVNHANSSSVSRTICNQALRQMYYAFNGEYPNTGNTSRVNTSSYSFTCGYSFD